MSLESLLNNTQWRDVLLSNTFMNNLVCVAIDEAHCVPKWGTSFRETYRRVGEIRSLIPSTVHFMGLTATAIRTTRNNVYQMLGMCQPTLIYVPSIKKTLFTL